MNNLIIVIVLSLTMGGTNLIFSDTLFISKNDSTSNTTHQNTQDTVKHVPGKYNHVDVKIVYPWNEDEPEWYRDVSCLLVKENGTITELKIFLKDCTEVMKVKKGLFSFEVYDSKTNKLIAKGPDEN